MMHAAGVAYLESGRGGAPLVCLHGIGGAAESFRPQLDGLGLHRRILSWDMPGYGESQTVSPVNFETLSEKLGQFLDVKGFERVHLVGHSIGGMIAMDYALRCPDQVASLVLIATTSAFGGRDPEFKEKFLEQRLAPLETGNSMRQVAERLVPTMIGLSASSAVIDAAIDWMADVPVETYRAVLECLVAFNRRDGIANIDCPACLIAGGEDRTAPAKTMERMASKMREAEFHLVENAGHLVNVEEPEKTNQIISDFLKKRFNNG
ncbi:alpha/beta hydrolase [Hoeflea sp. WL0058]|uniref:Alpha/beta hydrolase n=1 Tax=Flavimaribacter sediminis TaxID=2865987 RepID=A0AAE3D0G2_9HYPH|nr:alpha/beta hydrolase [Flavimaribacter sediminis]MBW8636997.1 alpha/beta hydrolase [Flavimaribacter sediminis]